MNDLDIIACGTGLHDALNPCIFMTSAVFMAYGFWLEKGPWQVGRLRAVFAGVYALAFYEFNFGPAQMCVLNKSFIFAAKVIYFVLGLWALVGGILFFKDWFLLVRGRRQEKTDTGEIQGRPAVKGFPVLFVTAGLAVALSALSVLGPIDNYIVLLSYEITLKGLVLRVLPVIAGYIIFSMWPLWLLWTFLSLRPKNVRPSLVKIICASVFLIASSCVIFMFQ